MKKRYLLFLLLIFLVPFNIKAFGIDKFYMDVTIKDNGDILVKELFKLNGEYNGFERKLRYGSIANQFDGTFASFEQSEIYNGSGIEIISIKGISYSGEYNFFSMFLDGNKFEPSNYATNGEYGKYVENYSMYGKDLRIFNPSTKGDLFYLEYIIKNVVVVHNDVAEIYFNIFFDEMVESIRELNVNVRLPQESKELLFWANGPLQGDISKSSNSVVNLTINSLNARNALDYRIVFDKELVTNSTKFSNVIAKEKIVEVQTKRADAANAIRSQLKTGYYALLGLHLLWFAFLIKNIFDVYNKYDKEHAKTLHTKYFRDFPREYGPEIVSYLYDRKIEPKDLSASILNLINRKNIKYQQDKKEFILILDNEEGLNESEKILVDWFFKDIGKELKVTIKEINKSARSYESFLKKYDSWKLLVEKEANKEELFENKKIPGGYYVYSFLGVALVGFSSAIFEMGVLSFFAIVGAIGSIIYMSQISKRTKKGHEEYQLWKGLENFLKDFGKFKERDLPQIELWEKYLVYAMSFGIAKKLSKVMQIKFKEMGDQARISGMDLYHINNLSMLNRSITNGVNGAVQSAINTKAAHSRSSSGSGYGGGFSGGGGFGGGGGGGGRF
jgi:uncharacterized membrane protein